MELKGTVYDSARITAKVLAAFSSGGWVFKGDYSDTTTYRYNDVVTVTKSGLLYLCIEDDPTGVTGKNPTTSASSWTYITGLYFEDNGVKADNLMLFDSTNNGLKVSTINPDDVSSAISNSHAQNTDQYLDFGGQYELSAENLSYTYNTSHDPNRDQYLDVGSTNQVSAVMLFNQLNYLYAAPEAFLPRTTNGAQYAKEESTTRYQMKGTWLFDPATSEGIQLEVRNYGTGSLTTKYFKCKLHYKVKMGNGVPEDTKFAFRILGAIEEDTVDVGWGTAVQLNQTIEAQNTIYHTAWSPLITASGTIAENCSLLIEINRYADDVDNDTYADDVAFVGAEFQFNIPAPS